MSPPLAQTFEAFDLVSELPAPRISVRRATQTDGRAGPQFSRQYDHRPLRAYEVTIGHATRAEIRRLNDLWNRTRFGVLPMLLDHPEDGQVAVVFDQRELSWRQKASVDAEFTVRLLEFL